MLTIEYTTEPVPPLSIARFEVITNEFRLYFLAEANRKYQVEFRDLLGGGEWISLTNLAPSSVSTNVVVGDVVNRSQRFYRLRSP